VVRSKKAIAVYGHKWYMKNRKRIALKNKLNYLKKRENNHNYYITHKNQILAQGKRRYLKKRKLIMHQTRKYYKKNRERMLISMRKNYHTHIERADRYLWINRKKILQQRQAYAKTKAAKRVRKKYVDANRFKLVAQEKARQMISLKDKQCQVCGTTKNLNRHHEDYTKPLEVIILCYRCHKKHHRTKNRQKFGAEVMKNGSK
jgi:hypothetical protein